MHFSILFPIRCSRFCSETLVLKSSESNFFGLKEETSIFLTKGRFYPLQFTFRGSLSLQVITSIQVYGFVENTSIAFDVTSLYFSHRTQLWNTSVLAGQPCSSRSAATVSSSLVTAGQYFTLAINVRDEFSNSVTDCKNKQILISSNFSLRQQIEMENCSSLMLNLTVSGSYSIVVPFSSIDFVSVEVVVVNSKFCPEKSDVKFLSSIATAGSPISLFFVARDSFQNSMPIDNYDGLPQGIVALDENSGERLVGSLVFANTSLSAIFTLSGQHRAIFRNKYGTVGMLFSMNVQPSAVCMSMVSVQGSGLSVATSGLLSRFTIISRDRYGNLNLASNWAAFENSSQKYQYLTSAIVGSELHFLRKPGSFKQSWSMSVFNFEAGSLTATFYARENFASPFSVDDIEVNTQQFDTLSSKVFQSKSAQFSGFIRINRGIVASFAFSDCQNSCTRVLIDGVVIFTCDYLKPLPISPGTWVFLVIEHACLHISAASPHVARALITESVSSTFLQSVSTFTAFHVRGSPFIVVAASGYPFLKTSLAQGSGLSVCTYGSLATFSILIRDIFSVSTSLSGSIIEFAAISRNTSTVTSVLSCQSSLAASHICNFSYFCGSSSLRLVHSKAHVPGLIGEYHETVSFRDYMQPGAVQGFTKIDYDLNFQDVAFSPLNHFDTTVNGVATMKNFGSQYFSIRWTGLLQAQLSDVYTLQCTSYGAVKLFIDGLMILTKPRTFQRQAVQGTVSLLQSAFVDLRIDYVHTIGRFGMKLEWKSRSQPFADIPQSVLWHSQSEVLPEFFVSAVAGAPLLSKSIINGAGLTIATAGILSNFRVFASDAIGLPTLLDTSRIWACAKSFGGPTFSSIRQSDVRSESPGNYVVSYLPMISGDYAFDILHMAPGMLMSTVYATSVFLNPVNTGLSSNLSLDSSVFTELFQNISLSSRMSASWKGFMKPAGVPITTFYVQLGSATDKIRVAVDGIIIIDKFTMMSASVTKISATILLSDVSHFYDISIDFAHATGSLKCAVTTQDGPIPSSRLFVSDILGSPAPSLLVRAGGACASTSKILGIGAVKSLPTDLRSNIELHIRDSYNNPTSIGVYQVRAIAYSSLCSQGSSNCDASVSLNTNQISDSIWNIVLSLTRSGKWSVDIALSQPGFLSATYYSSVGFSSPMSAGLISLNTNIKEDSKSVRMSGFIKLVESVRKFSFKWAGDHVYYPSLYVDHPFIGERNANYTKSPVANAGLDDLQSVLRMRDLKIDAPFLHPGFQPSLLWRFDNESWVPVPSNRFFTREVVNTMIVHVLPAKTCAIMSYVAGASFTLATCGMDAMFSIVARDEYSNVQNNIQDRWMVRLLRDASSVALIMSDPTNNNKVIIPALTNSSRHFVSGKNIVVIRFKSSKSNFVCSLSADTFGPHR